MGYGPDECPLCYLECKGNNPTGGQTGLICTDCLIRSSKGRIDRGEGVHHRVLSYFFHNSTGMGPDSNPSTMEVCEVCYLVKPILNKMSLCVDHFGAHHEIQDDDKKGDEDTDDHAHEGDEEEDTSDKGDQKVPLSEGNKEVVLGNKPENQLESNKEKIDKFMSEVNECARRLVSSLIDKGSS